MRRLSQKDGDDIRWYWVEAEGAMGARSVNLAGVGGGSVEANTAAIKAAGRERVIRRALEMIGKRASGVLRRYYSMATPVGCAAFGDLAAVVAHLPTARAAYRSVGRSDRRGFLTWLRDLSRGARLSSESHADAMLRARLVAEAERQVAEDSAAYAVAAAAVRAGAKRDKRGRRIADSRAAAVWQEKLARRERG